MSKVERVSVFDIINESFDYLVRPEQEIPEGMGKCTGCDELIYPGQDDWDGTDGGYHYPEHDAGGGDVENIRCGHVVREKHFKEK